MRTTLTTRGQTAVPAAIRERYRLRPGMRLEWLDTGHGIKVFPVPEDPITAFHGIAKGEHLIERLYQERREDRVREQSHSPVRS